MQHGHRPEDTLFHVIVGGITRTVLFNPYHKIGKLKDMLFIRTRVPQEQQILVHTGQMLDSCRTITESLVQPGSTIEMLVKSVKLPLQAGDSTLSLKLVRKRLLCVCWGRVGAAFCDNLAVK